MAPYYGRKERGPAERATALILPASEVAHALALLHRSHGLIGLVATWIRHLRGMRDVFIAVRPV